MIKLITAALQAYLTHLHWQHRNYVYDLEDEIDDLAADGSPSAKLQLERLAKRLKFERERIARSPYRDAD
jgi:hypothetical protein